MRFITLLKTFVGVCAYDSLPLLKGSDLPCDVMIMAIYNVHETGCIFEYIFWTTTHWPIDINKDNSFQELLEKILSTGIKFSFQFSNLLQLLNNKLHKGSSALFFFFFFFENMNKGHGKWKLIKMVRSCYIIISIK